jgi:MOSC domain-containing protein YiiM
MTGRVHQINTSCGGVPKLSVSCARITAAGVEGDQQRDTRHGGPDRAVCLFSLDVIERLQAEGHPIAPGTTGDNLTIAGLDWTRVIPGARLSIGEDRTGVEIQIVSYTRPCSAIRDSFKELHHNRIWQDEHPGESRVCARVLREGIVRVGDAVWLL